METTRYRGIISDNARWDAVALRDDDIIVSTPAKCGTTWMQTCVALVLFQSPELPAPLAELSPWVDMLTWPLDELVDVLGGQQHRRFLKTHTPLDGLPWDPSVTYLCVGRDPRDVALSWDNHTANMNVENLFGARIAAVGTEGMEALVNHHDLPSDDPVERYWRWMDHDPAEGDDPLTGLRNLVHHVRTFWDRRHEPNVHLFHYADLRADLAGQLRRVATALGVHVPDAQWPVLVEAATFEQMKAKAGVLAPGTTHKIWLDESRFFDKARLGGWRDVITTHDDERRYETRLASLCDPDMAAWLHHGSSDAA